jgi:hypothetical protein
MELLFLCLFMLIHKILIIKGQPIHHNPTVNVAIWHNFLSLYDHYPVQFTYFEINLLTGRSAGNIKPIVKLFQDFQLSHLLSPSASHLGFMSLLLRKTRFIPQLLLTLAMGYVCYHFNLHPGLLRALLWMTVKRISVIYAKHKFTIFIIYLIIDYYFGTYHLSPMGYLYSGVFMYVFTCTDYSILQKVFLGNILLAVIFNKGIYPFALLLSVPLSFLFMPLFLLSLMTFLTQIPSLQADLANATYLSTTFYIQFITYLRQHYFNILSLYINPHCCLLLFIYLKKQISNDFFLLIILLGFYSVLH